MSIVVVGARELNKADVMELSDPFCILHFGGSQRKTTVVNTTVNPLWGEKFIFAVPKRHIDWGGDLDDHVPPTDQHVTAPHDIPLKLEMSIHDYDGALLPAAQMGSVEVSYQAILDGVERAHAKGFKEWEAFFWLGPHPERMARGRVYVNINIQTWDEYEEALERHRHVTALAATGGPAPLPPEHRRKPIGSRPDFWAGQTARVSSKTRKYRVLSLDGGGVRGVMSATIMHRLCTRYPYFLESVDLLAGTSTGGILAILFAAGYSPAQAKRIYEVFSPSIFQSNSMRRYSLFSARYPDGPKYAAFNNYVKGVTLGDLGKHVLVTSFRMDGISPSARKSFFGDVKSWRPALLSNIPRAGGPVDPDLTIQAIDVAMMTSAAPTYFPLYQVGGKGSLYVDGGVFANAPSAMAVSKARAHYPALTNDNMCVFSLGAGHFNHNVTVEPGESADWGMRQWAPTMLDLIMDSNRLANEYVMGMLLKERYMRVDPHLTNWVALDSYDDIEELVAVGYSLDLSAAHTFIENQWFGDAHSKAMGWDKRVVAEEPVTGED